MVAPSRGIFILAIEADARDTFYGLYMHPELSKSNEIDCARWDIEGSTAQLAQLASHLHPVTRRFCELAQMPHLWTIKTRRLLQVCVRGRVVATGDACHPRLPHYGQGAASAVEDAASLGVFMKVIAGTINVVQRLRMWQEFRLPRTTAIQSMASSYAAPLETLEDRIRNECGYRRLLPEDINGHEYPVQTWLFNYDVVKEANRHLDSLSSSKACLL